MLTRDYSLVQMTKQRKGHLRKTAINGSSFEIFEQTNIHEEGVFKD